MHSNADIDCFVRMPPDPSSIDLKVEMLPKLCKKEGTTLEPTSPLIDGQLSHWTGKYAGRRLIIVV